MGHYTTIDGQTVKFRGLLMRWWRHICHGIVRLGREQELINRQSLYWRRTPPECPTCLHVLPVDSNFCYKCGVSQNAQQKEPQTDRLSSDEVNRRIGRSQKKKTITGLFREQKSRMKESGDLWQLYNREIMPEKRERDDE